MSQCGQQALPTGAFRDFFRLVLMPLMQLV